MWLVPIDCGFLLAGYFTHPHWWVIHDRGWRHPAPHIRRVRPLIETETGGTDNADYRPVKLISGQTGMKFHRKRCTFCRGAAAKEVRKAVRTKIFSYQLRTLLALLAATLCAAIIFTVATLALRGTRRTAI
jgi:hypothetical protein